MRVGAEVIKEVPEYFVSSKFNFRSFFNFKLQQIFFKLEFRTTTNWRHIVTLPEIDYCLGMKLGTLIPQYSKLIEISIKQFFSDASMGCPIKPGKYYSKDIMMHTGEEKQFNISKAPTATQKNGFGFELPNGKYRYTLRISTKIDPNYYFLQWILEVKIRLNGEKF
jgi:hypothetical protein